ncbi:hypothetical protein [Polynucleobacter sp. AP-Nickl1-40-C4]|uniref:hypothetical protein n=1 Tax=Polynucleobacter sp. AP-Nickl1-40-C4 TaxID=3108275 RepID=UPI002B235A93|nr:hypothetical protein [Polynucleobacter sp. AP-Nickl1-40-C4]MEA9568783.1 hypothetical protein [Polynucleobacter sp. AP-Nickl1-40-C4]
MNTINFNRRLALKGIGAMGTSGALVACGGGGSSSPAIQYFTEPYMPAGSTEITGVRGVSNSTDVFLTGINMDTTTTPTTNYGLLYRGPLLIPNVSSWNKIGPAKTIIKKVGTDTSSGLNFYGPNNGASSGSIVVVGNYNLTGVSTAYGLLYLGSIDGSGTYTKISPDSLTVGTVSSTIAHSNMNGYVVGNFNTSLDSASHAFIMAIGSAPTNPNTYTYFDIPLSIVSGGAASITAYGIWYNSNLNNYTIVGGYSKVIGDNGLSTGYIVDWDPIGGFVNFAPLFYNNDSTTSKVSHVEGITTDNAGGYYLSIDWAQTSSTYPTGAALVQVGRNSSGGFGTPTWTNFAFPGAAITSANTVFEKNVLGVYADPAPTTPYLAVFP